MQALVCNLVKHCLNNILDEVKPEKKKLTLSLIDKVETFFLPPSPASVLFFQSKSLYIKFSLACLKATILFSFCKL